jgi:hypothetical protein
MRFAKLAHLDGLVNGLGSWELGVGIGCLRPFSCYSSSLLLFSSLPTPNSQLFQL